MQRAISLVIVSAFISAIAVGCTAPVNQSTQNGYGVLFDGTPVISDRGIYHLGVQVGNVIGTASGGSVTRLNVQLQPEFVSLTGNNVAFFVQAGRLEADTLANMGQALEKGVVLCGFTSKAALRWFKLKTVFRDRIGAAQRRAMQLNQRMG